MANFGALASNATIPANALGDDVLPLGSVIDWYRVTTATTVPAGWAVCDGSLWNDLDNQMGSSKAKLTTGNIPNLIGKVTVGARLTTTAGGLTAADGTASSNGDAYANAPGIGGTGGSNAIKAGHGHGFSLGATGSTANLTVTSGGTGITFSAESPGTTGSGYHYHSTDTYNYQFARDFNTGTASTGSFTRLTSGIFSYPTGYTNIIGDHTHTVNSHGHGFSDPGHGHGTTQSNHTHGVSGNVGPNTDGDNAVDVRPAHVGLLKIMKVKIV